MQSCNFDQSAYISYLVEEAVKESEALEKPPTSSEDQSSLETLDCFTSTYPADITLPQNTDAFGSPLGTNGSFHQQLALPAQGYINYPPTGDQSYIAGHQGPVSTLHQTFPESSPPFVTSSNHLGLQNHNTNFSFYKRCSFRLDQHIGLNQPPIINASQLNNKIQVQYHFTDSDRFSVQSTCTSGTQVNEPNHNWQTINNVFPNNLLFNTAELNDNNTIFSSGVQQKVLNLNPSSQTYAETSDYSQFKVANVIAKRTTAFQSDINRRETFPDIEKRVITRQAEENEYCNFFMLKEKQKSREKDIEQNQSNSKYVEDKNSKIQNTVPKELERNDNIVSSEGDKYNIKKVISKSVKNPENLRLQRGKYNTCRASCQIDTAVNKNIAENNHNTEKKPDYHQFSREYYKEYLEFVKKQKEEKAHFHSVSTDTSGSNVAKDTGIELLSFKYECGECMKTFYDNKEFKKHIEKFHSSKKKKNVETVNKSNAKNEPDLVDFMGSEVLGDTSMAFENEDREKIATENENETSKPQSYLCSYCGYTCNTLSESSEHLKIHGGDSESTERLSQKEEREYLQMSKELLERKKTEEDVRKQTEEINKKESLTSIKEKVDEKDVTVQKRPSCYPLSCSKKMADEDMIEKKSSEETSSKEQRTWHRRKAATQAKNNLMNPSKGKQKRVRDIKNLNQEDKSLMKMFGIIPSKVCLSRVEQSGDMESHSENNSSYKKCQKRGSKAQELNECTSPRKKKATNSESNKAVYIGNRDTDLTNDTETMVSDDSDVEIVEPPKTVIVLDENIAESTQTKGSPVKSDKVILKEFGLKNVAIKLDKAENIADKLPLDQVNRIKTDAELLEKFGIKDLSVNLTCPDVARKKNAPSKLKKRKPGPKSKTQITEIQARKIKSTSDVSIKDIEELSQDEIEKMLYECGMGISVPISSKSIVNDHRDKRTPSPVPSTSKGHGHLKRKRTARKSTKDSALFKKYKLKDSMVILKSLSKIDISLIRNPNSPFGKSDWLKHKFDSDTESDFEFDIPTPPLLEDFVESSGSSKVDTQSSKMGISGSGGRDVLKQKDLKIMEKFGIVDSVVVIDSPRKKEVPLCSETNKRRILSDDELRKKFGIPSTIVVVNSPGKLTSNDINVGKTPSLISFSDFRSALDSARKNILGKMKDNQGSDNSPTKDIDTQKKASVLKNTARKTRKTAAVKEENVSSPKRLKLEGKEMSRKRFILRSSRRDSQTFDDQKQTEVKPVTTRKRFPYSCNAEEDVLNKTLPRRLKTLSVNIKRLKLNEALKTYKAKAVSRAMEVRHKKNRNQKDTGNGVKSSNGSSENSMKRIENTRKREQIKKAAEEKMDTLVMKTARYRLSCASKNQNVKSTENSNIEKMAKKLPVVKVAVPCLSDDEISRLSQNIHSVGINSGKTQISDAEKIAEEVINEIIDKICCPEEVSAKTCQQLRENFLDKDENEKVNSISLQKIDPDTEDSKENNNNETNLFNSAEIRNEIISKRDKDSDDENKAKSETVLSDSESDLSLISITSETKESERNSASYQSRKDCLTHVDNSIACKDTCIIKETGMRCIAEYDTIPIGCSTFYDEGVTVKDSSFDEVDGDTKGPVAESPGNLSSRSNEKYTEIKNTNSREFDNNLKLFEMGIKQGKFIPVESVSTTSEEKGDKKDYECKSSEEKGDKKDYECKSSDDRSVGSGEFFQNSILSCQNNETELCYVDKTHANEFAKDNDPVEETLSNESMCSLNKAKLTGSLQIDINNLSSTEEDGLTEMRMLNAIIESGSGSRIGDVNTIDEIRKFADISDLKQETFDVAKENLPDCDRCKSPSELDETVMEH